MVHCINTPTHPSPHSRILVRPPPPSTAIVALLRPLQPPHPHLTGAPYIAATATLSSSRASSVIRAPFPLSFSASTTLLLGHHSATTPYRRTPKHPSRRAPTASSLSPFHSPSLRRRCQPLHPRSPQPPPPPYCQSPPSLGFRCSHCSTAENVLLFYLARC